jgi:hypothetical protein
MVDEDRGGRVSYFIPVIVVDVLLLFCCCEGCNTFNVRTSTGMCILTHTRASMCCRRSFLRIHQKSSGRGRISHHETKRNRNRNSPDETRRQDRGVVDPAIRAPHVQVLVGEYPIDGNGRGVQDVIDLEYQT